MSLTSHPREGKPCPPKGNTGPALSGHILARCGKRGGGGKGSLLAASQPNHLLHDTTKPAAL